MAKYKRVLLKLSGEALAQDQKGLYDYDFLEAVARSVKKTVDAGIDVAIMVGAGNIWRGRQGGSMSRTSADSMGMLATCINSIMVCETLKSVGVDACVLTSVEMQAFAEPYATYRAKAYLDEGRVVILGGGSGLPFFSTDTGASLRCAEIGADVMLMAKNIDGIYTDDPKTNADAVKLDTISAKDILKNGLRAIDATAAAFLMEVKIPVLVFGLDDPDNIYRAAMGESIGTVITTD